MFKQELSFATPILNAAGFLGYVLVSEHPLSLEILGAFFTNPISLRPRSPARPPRTMPVPGGFLLHTGYPNPGLSTAIERYASQWARTPVPVIVHLLAADPDALSQAVASLEETEGVAGLEVGLSPGCGPHTAANLIEAALGELPLIVRLPFENAVALARELLGFPIAGVSLGPPRGAAAAPDGSLINGRLYGPGIYPQALARVMELVQGNIPVIAAGGVYRVDQIETLLSTGAQAVQLDAVLWRGDLGVESLQKFRSETN